VCELYESTLPVCELYDNFRARPILERSGALATDRVTCRVTRLVGEKSTKSPKPTHFGPK
jgi:hypothetical protein